MQFFINFFHFRFIIEIVDNMKNLLFSTFELSIDDNVFDILVAHYGMSDEEKKQSKITFREDHDKKAIKTIINLITHFNRFDIDIAINTVIKMDSYSAKNFILEMEYFGLTGKNLKDLYMLFKENREFHDPKHNFKEFTYSSTPIFRVLDPNILYMGMDKNSAHVFYDFIEDKIYRDKNFVNPIDLYADGVELFDPYVYLDKNRRVEWFIITSHNTNDENNKYYYDLWRPTSNGMTMVESIEMGRGMSNNPNITITDYYAEYNYQGNKVSIPIQDFTFDDVNTLYKIKTEDGAAYRTGRQAFTENFNCYAKNSKGTIKINIFPTDNVRESLFSSVQTMSYVPTFNEMKIYSFKIGVNDNKIILALQTTDYERTKLFNRFIRVSF